MIDVPKDIEKEDTDGLDPAEEKVNTLLDSHINAPKLTKGPVISDKLLVLLTEVWQHGRDTDLMQHLYAKNLYPKKLKAIRPTYINEVVGVGIVRTTVLRDCKLRLAQPFTTNVTVPLTKKIRKKIIK